MTKEYVSDALWAIIVPLIPSEPAKPQGGRPRLSNRATLNGIRFVLQTGIGWEHLPQELGWGSGMTCWRRLRDWHAAGMWQRLHHERLQDAGQIDWSRAAVDASSVSAQGGSSETGPNPTDRGRAGIKRHLVVDRYGISLAVLLSGANIHDTQQGVC